MFMHSKFKLDTPLLAGSVEYTIKKSPTKKSPDSRPLLF